MTLFHFSASPFLLSTSQIEQMLTHRHNTSSQLHAAPAHAAAPAPPPPKSPTSRTALSEVFITRFWAATTSLYGVGCAFRFGQVNLGVLLCLFSPLLLYSCILLPLTRTLAPAIRRVIRLVSLSVHFAMVAVLLVHWEADNALANLRNAFSLCFTSFCLISLRLHALDTAWFLMLQNLVLTPMYFTPRGPTVPPSLDHDPVVSIVMQVTVGFLLPLSIFYFKIYKPAMMQRRPPRNYNPAFASTDRALADVDLYSFKFYGIAPEDLPADVQDRILEHMRSRVTFHRRERLSAGTGDSTLLSGMSHVVPTDAPTDNHPARNLLMSTSVLDGCAMLCVRMEDVDDNHVPVSLHVEAADVLALLPDDVRARVTATEVHGAKARRGLHVRGVLPRAAVEDVASCVLVEPTVADAVHGHGRVCIALPVHGLTPALLESVWQPCAYSTALGTEVPVLGYTLERTEPPTLVVHLPHTHVCAPDALMIGVKRRANHAAPPPTTAPTLPVLSVVGGVEDDGSPRGDVTAYPFGTSHRAALPPFVPLHEFLVCSNATAKEALLSVQGAEAIVKDLQAIIRLSCMWGGGHDASAAGRHKARSALENIERHVEETIDHNPSLRRFLAQVRTLYASTGPLHAPLSRASLLGKVSLIAPWWGVFADPGLEALHESARKTTPPLHYHYRLCSVPAVLLLIWACVRWPESDVSTSSMLAALMMAGYGGSVMGSVWARLGFLDRRLVGVAWH